jgi:hypothetical protein
MLSSTCDIGDADENGKVVIRLPMFHLTLGSLASFVQNKVFQSNRGFWVRICLEADKDAEWPVSVL